MKKRIAILMSLILVMTGSFFGGMTSICYADEIEDYEETDEDYEDDEEEEDDWEEDEELYEEGDEIVTSNGYQYEVFFWDEELKNGTVAFCGAGKTSVKSIQIPAVISDKGYKFKVVAVEEEACEGYKKLQTVKIANNVEEIEEDAFKNCPKLKNVTIGQGVKSIGAKAFYGDKNLKTIKITSKKLTSVGKNAFRNISNSCTVKVPSKKIAAYKKLFQKGGATKKVTFAKAN